MAHKLNLSKAIQAIAVLLHSDRCNRMSYLRLLKLLYIADRESLAKTGRSITGDRVVAMKHGPVLSEVYYLVESNHQDAGKWGEFLQKDGYQLELIRDPGTGDLSPYELRKLREIAERYKNCDEWDVVKVTHDFPEWVRNRPDEARGVNVCDIPMGDVLAAVGHADNAADIQREVDDEVREDALLDRLFGR